MTINGKQTVAEAMQGMFDEKFVSIVGHLTDVGVRFEYIVNLYDLEN